MDEPPDRAAVEERISYIFDNTVPELCRETNVSADDVRVIFDMLQPKLDEAKANLPPIESPPSIVDGEPVKTEDGSSENFSSLLLMYDELDQIQDDLGRTPKWMLPKRALGEKAWAGAFAKILDSKELDLSETEMQALRKIDYMVYVECVYSVVVNRLCYALAHANNPNFDVLKTNPSIQYVVYRVPLAKKIKFIRDNTKRPPKGVPDIVEACDIDLRNTIAHGSLVGKPAWVARHFFRDVAEKDDPAYVTRFDKAGSLESVRLVDLAVEHEKVRVATNVWNLALNTYWNLSFTGWWAIPQSMWRPHGFDFTRGEEPA